MLHVGSKEKIVLHSLYRQDVTATGLYHQLTYTHTHTHTQRTGLIITTNSLKLTRWAVWYHFYATLWIPLSLVYTHTQTDTQIAENTYTLCCLRKWSQTVCVTHLQAKNRTWGKVLYALRQSWSYTKYRKLLPAVTHMCLYKFIYACTHTFACAQQILIFIWLKASCTIVHLKKLIQWRKKVLRSHLCLHKPSISDYLQRLTLDQSGMGISEPTERSEITSVIHFNHSLMEASTQPCRR